MICSLIQIDRRRRGDKIRLKSVPSYYLRLSSMILPARHGIIPVERAPGSRHASRRLIELARREALQPEFNTSLVKILYNLTICESQVFVLYSAV